MRELGQIIGKRLVDHDNILAFGSVVPGEVAATDASAHGAQIAGRNDIDERGAGIFVGSLHALDPRRAPRAVLSEGQIVGNACSLDAGDGADACDHFLEDDTALLSGQRTIFISRHGVVVINFDGGRVFGLEAKIDAEDAEKAAQQQAGANEQHTGQGDLGDDKDRADAVVLAALS